MGEALEALLVSEDDASMSSVSYKEPDDCKVESYVAESPG